MANNLNTSRFETVRGGKQRTVSFSEFVCLTRNADRPTFVVEAVITPDLSENSWGGFLIREGATRVLPKFRRS